MPFRRHKFRENRCSESHILLRGVKMRCPIFSIFPSDMDVTSHRKYRQKLLGDWCDVQENRCNDSHILFERVSEFQSMLLTFGACATSRTVSGSIPGGFTGDFFRGSFRQNLVPWGRLSLWKWVTGISPGVKAADAYGWRPTTLVVSNVEKIRGLNLPGIPWATSACRGIPLFFYCKVLWAGIAQAV